MNTVLMVFLPFVVFFIWLTFLRAGQDKACPDCGAVLPRFQAPFTKTKMQWLEGGYLCQSCGCETNNAGIKVAAGTVPSQRSFITAIGLVSLAGIPALFLLVNLLRG